MRVEVESNSRPELWDAKLLFQVNDDEDVVGFDLAFSKLQQLFYTKYT